MIQRVHSVESFDDLGLLRLALLFSDHMNGLTISEISMEHLSRLVLNVAEVDCAAHEIEKFVHPITLRKEFKLQSGNQF